MPRDFLPQNDSEFDNWQRLFESYLNANLAALGVDPLDPDLAAINAAAADWQAKLPAHRTKRNEAQAARQDKDDSKRAYEEAIRRMTRRLQVSAAVGDDERAGLGIPRRDTIRTRPAAPASNPILQIDTSSRLQLTIRFRDSDNAAPRARPKGVLGCELWIKIGGDLPQGLHDFTFLALAPCTPYIARFDGAQTNHTAYFIARWMNTRGEFGPWSTITSATIPG